MKKNFLIQYMTKDSRISSYIFENFPCKGLRIRSLPYFFIYVYEESIPQFFFIGASLDMTCPLYTVAIPDETKFSWQSIL